MGYPYYRTPKVNTPYKSRISAFEAISIHYDDEHKCYHLCGGNYDPAKERLSYFRLNVSKDYYSLTLARRAILDMIELAPDTNGVPNQIPVHWKPPVKSEKP